MKSLSKVRWIATLVAILSSRTPANRIANWGLVLSVLLLLGAEEHARRTWRDRAMSAQTSLAKATLEISTLRHAAAQAKEGK